MALEMGAEKIILETDCQNVVSKLRNEELDRSIHGPLVEDIKPLLRNLLGSDAKFVKLEANGVAHRFAKDGYEKKIGRLWVCVPSVYVMNLDVSVDV
jgi:hypothetical protein